MGRGGTAQAHVERDALRGAAAARLHQLDLGDASLVFGSLDLEATGDTFHVGRVAVNSADHEPLVVDWRAPAAEPFYRATGREPLGLRRRRHFATRGDRLLGIEDEYFGAATAEHGLDGSGLGASAGEDGANVDQGHARLVDGDGRDLRGVATLSATLDAGRTGRLGDIVGTIQAEQDEIIRAPMPGVLVVQGGPGTGKTVVALHRAAYLLYTHRFPLEGQGVLVVGPNRLFIAYIEQVLPSLGEAGVQLAVLGDLIDEVRVEGRDGARAGRVKGGLEMPGLLERALADRQRPLRDDLVVGFGAGFLRLSVADSADIVAEARRRFERHNSARPFVERRVAQILAASGNVGPSSQRHGLPRREIEADEVLEHLRGGPEWRSALEWMWPVLTPAQFLRDLFGSRALLRSAAAGRLRGEDLDSLRRERVPTDEAPWTVDDVPVLDEAFDLLGERPRRRRGALVSTPTDIRTYGHIVVDEAQDLSPMQLRMLRRRSLNGSMTIVGDIAQSTGAWAHADWDEVLAHLPDRHPPRSAELTVGYRTPASLVGPAAAVLAVAAPQLTPPLPVRPGG